MLNMDHSPRDSVAVWLEEIREFPAIDFNIQDLDPKMVCTLHEAGFRVFTYTCNEIQQIQKACNYGVDGIISDYPARVIEFEEAETKKHGK